jgi:hypothetical protein
MEVQKGMALLIHAPAVAVCFTQVLHCRRHLPDKTPIGRILAGYWT